MKRMSGIIAPFAAAAIGFDGSSDVSHAANVCAWPPAASSPAASAAPGGSCGAPRRCGSKREERGAERHHDDRGAGQQQHETRAASVRRGGRSASMSVAEATPVISSETTSGITVMRMALTHSVPIGAMASAAR